MSQVDLRQGLLHVLDVVRGNRSGMAGGPHVDAGGFGFGRNNSAGFALLLHLLAITSTIAV